MTEEAKPLPKAPRWMRVALIISLAINLLIIGLVVGAVANRPKPGDRMSGRNAAAPFIAALPPEDRIGMIREMREAAGPLMQNRRKVRRGFDALVRAIGAESFDRSEVEALLSAQRGDAAARQGIGERILLDRLEAMTAEERAAYAERLRKALKRGPPKRNGE